MKKSTILLLVVVYILSFFVIGLLGASIKNYDPEIYPESVELVEPDGRTTLTINPTDPDTGEKLYDYYFVYRNYSSGGVRIRAIVKPDNTTYPDVIFTKDEKNTNFTIEDSKTNKNIEKNYVLITPDQELIAKNETVPAKFTVIPENPGAASKIKACVMFVPF